MLLLLAGLLHAGTVRLLIDTYTYWLEWHTLYAAV
jgi:hypothetical protein